MAAAGRHGGHYVQKNSRFLLRHFEQFWGHRSFGWTSALCQLTAEVNKEPTETIVIPKKKTWSKEAVLKALASTVSRDPSSCPYQFIDDPYLAPKSSTEFHRFSLAYESGRAAAKYFINTHPKFFTKDFAEPHIPCLMPKTVTPLLEDVSEEALQQQISLRKVTAAVEMYDKLLQAGTTVSMETSQELLDLICLYCDRDPVEEGAPVIVDLEGSEENPKKVRDSFKRKPAWRKGNNAERIFNLLPERDTRCYSALIRGMVKHDAYEKAFSTYTDLLNNRLTGDVHIFNALISAVPKVRSTYEDKWALITELLKQMHQQKVQPNLLTFNAVLKSLRSCGYIAKTEGPKTLNEMKALGIAPSLATYAHILASYKAGPTGITNLEVLHALLKEMAGTSFTCQDPDDTTFFCLAMRVCLANKDLDLAHEVQCLAEVGENWRMIGNTEDQKIYYGRYFNLLCTLEHIDVVYKWYRQHIPSMYFPGNFLLKDMIQVMDTDNRLDLLPILWKDIQSMGLARKPSLMEELLVLMAREKHSPEVQESFAACALEIKSVYDDPTVSLVNWTSATLSQVTFLLLRGNKTQQAWEMLPLFEKNGKVPSNDLMEEFLSVCHSDGSARRAVELVQMSAAFGLQVTAKLAKQTLADFELTDKQRAIVSELNSAEEAPTAD